MSDQTDAETSDNIQHSQETDVHAPSGIRTHNSSEWPQTHTLDRVATGIGFHE